MPSPLLVDVESVRKRASLPDTKTVRDAIEGAVESATQVVPAELRYVDVSRADVSDVFFVERSQEFRTTDRRSVLQSRRVGVAVAPAKQTKLLLSRGFVDEGAQALTAVASLTEDGLTAQTDGFVDLRSVDGVDHVSVEAERGCLRVNDFGLAACYVLVTYKAGLLDDEGEPALFQGAPNWLRELVILDALLSLQQNPSLRREQVPEDQIRDLRRRRAGIALDRARYFPMAWAPIDASATPSST